jgi:hypothetical protein
MREYHLYKFGLLKKSKVMATLNTLLLYLRQKLDLERTGGVLFPRDANTLILADRSVLSSQQFKLIEATFPQVSYSIISCETSLSGFIIVFACDIECDRQWQRSVLRLLMHLVCFVYVSLTISGAGGRSA